MAPSNSPASNQFADVMRASFTAPRCSTATGQGSVAQGALAMWRSDVSAGLKGTDADRHQYNGDDCQSDCRRQKHLTEVVRDQFVASASLPGSTSSSSGASPASSFSSSSEKSSSICSSATSSRPMGGSLGSCSLGAAPVGAVIISGFMGVSP